MRASERYRERYQCPWNYRRFGKRQSTNSLRECCVRVAHLTDSEVIWQAACHKRGTLFSTVLEWRRQQPMPWRTLLTLLEIPIPRSAPALQGRMNAAKVARAS